MKKILPILAVLVAAFTAHAGQLVTFAKLPSGDTSSAGLTIGANGNFYGTFVGSGGGFRGEGASAGIFELTQQGVLAATIPMTNSIGVNPSGPLLLDTNSGNLFGTASAGGNRAGDGTIFEISPDDELSLLTNFSGSGGIAPVGSLLISNKNIYGVTAGGGSDGFGTVFQVTPKGVISDLLSFAQTNGQYPLGGLVFGSNAFYGSTASGGSSGFGTIFSVTTNKKANVIGSFPGSNGVSPGALTADRAGNIYGVTQPFLPFEYGWVFKISASGDLITLHQFRGTDGAIPNSPLLLASDGKLYGTTQTRGAYGLGTLFSVTTNGNFSLLASFDGTNGATPMGGVIEGLDGNLYGTTVGLSNNGTVFQFGGLPPEIVTPPLSRAWAPNGTTTFSVVAAGTQPITFQWLFDNSAILNATNSSFVLAGESVTNIGDYTVVVSNRFGSSQATAGLTNPLPSTTMKAMPAEVTDPGQVTAQGTAGSNLGVTDVQVQVNAGGWMDANSSDGFAHWTAGLQLTPGPNVIQAISINSIGATSRVVTNIVFYLSAGQFTWSTNGYGSITASRPTNGLLPIGKPLTLTAAPKKDNLFLNWIITSNSTISMSSDNPLTILMPANLAVQANFVSNYFSSSETGTYVGLFIDSNSITPRTAGMIQFSVAKSAGVSGTVRLGGSNYGFSGAFRGDGSAVLTAKRSVIDGGPISVALSLPSGASSVTGTVSGTNNVGGANGGWSVPLLALPAATTKGTARYTALILPDANSAFAPPGDGYILLSSAASVFTLAGATADGSPINQVAPISTTELFPFYASVESGSGILIGWLDFSSGAPVGQAAWVKDNAFGAVRYARPFTNAAPVQGSAWTKPAAGQPTINLDGLAVTASGGALSTPADVPLTTANAGATVFSGNEVTGTINPATGQLHVTLSGSGISPAIKGVGAVLQNADAGGGYFLTSTNAGLIQLH